MHTKRQLQQAALELFAKNGYDETTTDEIAERAGVSPRTFFRYFATKESVLFVGESLWFESFGSEFLKRPLSMSEPKAMADALLSLAPGLAKSRRSLAIYDRAVTSSPALRGRVAEHQQEDILTLARLMAERRGTKEPDDGLHLAAAVCLLTYRRALMKWVNGPAGNDLADGIAAEFALLQGMHTPVPALRKPDAAANGRASATN